MHFFADWRRWASRAQEYEEGGDEGGGDGGGEEEEEEDLPEEADPADEDEYDEEDDADDDDGEVGPPLRRRIAAGQLLGVALGSPCTCRRARVRQGAPGYASSIMQPRPVCRSPGALERPCRPQAGALACRVNEHLGQRLSAAPAGGAGGGRGRAGHGVPGGAGPAHRRRRRPGRVQGRGPARERGL